MSNETSTAAPLRVALRAASDELIARWKSWLADDRLHLVDAAQAAARDAADLVILGPDTDSPASDSAHQGVIRVGCAGPADITLPVDVTPRELVLACRLVGQLARQRRALHDALSAHEHWQVAALTDPLTGLANRRAWDEQWQARVAEAHRRGQTACAAIIDLDRFKSLNDAQGHLVGDQVLQCCGRALASSLRHSDFLARLGGDEFAVLLADVLPASASVVVERARASVAAALERASLPPLTASAGLCLAPPGQPDLTQLLESADRGLRRAKQTGRNRTVVELLSDACP